MSEELFDKSNDNRIRQNCLIMNTDEVVDLLNSQSKLISAYNYEFAKMRKENEQLRRYVYHCPQICNIILAYLRKCESEDVKAVSDAMDYDKYFDDDIDTLRSWE